MIYRLVSFFFGGGAFRSKKKLDEHSFILDSHKSCESLLRKKKLNNVSLETFRSPPPLRCHHSIVNTEVAVDLSDE